MTGADEEIEGLIGAWSGRYAGVPLAAARRKLIAADLERFAAALAAAGEPPIEAEPVVSHRRILLRAAGTGDRE